MKQSFVLAIALTLARVAPIRGQQQTTSITLGNSDRGAVAYQGSSVYVTSSFPWLGAHVRGKTCGIGGQAFGSGLASSTRGYWSLTRRCGTVPGLILRPNAAHLGEWFVNAPIPIKFCYASLPVCRGEIYLKALWTPYIYFQEPAHNNAAADWFGSYDFAGEHSDLSALSGALVESGAFRDSASLFLNVAVQGGNDISTLLGGTDTFAGWSISSYVLP
jgi:hypothetical protein